MIHLSTNSLRQRQRHDMAFVLLMALNPLLLSQKLIHVAPKFTHCLLDSIRGSLCSEGPVGHLPHRIEGFFVQATLFISQVLQSLKLFFFPGVGGVLDRRARLSGGSGRFFGRGYADFWDQRFGRGRRAFTG